MACDTLRYTAVDPSKWACARDVVGEKYGIRIDSDRGDASRSGFTLRWAYDPTEQTLEIECTDKPFVVPCGVVNDRVKAIAERCGIVGGD